MVAKPTPLLWGMFGAVCGQVALICALVGEFAQDAHHDAAEFQQALLHTSSGRSREISNGASTTVDSRVPRTMPTHSKTESTTMVVTRIRKSPQTAASSRLLNISVCVSATLAAAT